MWFHHILKVKPALHSYPTTALLFVRHNVSRARDHTKKTYTVTTDLEFCITSWFVVHPHFNQKPTFALLGTGDLWFLGESTLAALHILISGLRYICKINACCINYIATKQWLVNPLYSMIVSPCGCKTLTLTNVVHDNRTEVLCPLKRLHFRKSFKFHANLQ